MTRGAPVGSALVAEASGHKDLAREYRQRRKRLEIREDMDEATKASWRSPEEIAPETQGNAEGDRKLGALLETDDKGTIKNGSNGKVTSTSSGE